MLVNALHAALENTELVQPNDLVLITPQSILEKSPLFCGRAAITGTYAITLNAYLYTFQNRAFLPFLYGSHIYAPTNAPYVLLLSEKFQHKAHLFLKNFRRSFVKIKRG